MRLLLVNPSITTLRYDVRPVLAPLGIMYIASMARKRGHQVSIFDFVAEGVDDAPKRLSNKGSAEFYLRYGTSDTIFLDRMRQFRPDVVGFSNIMAVTEHECLRLARLVKQHYPQVRTVIGGTNCTARVNAILDEPHVDFAYKGEGDASFIDFLDAFDSPNEYDSLAGICYRHNGRPKISPETPILEDLDTNPLPAWDMIDIEKYLKADFPFSFHLKRRTTTMISSRGCVRNCIFCSGKNLLGSWRGRSAESTIEEALVLKEKYGIEEVQFLDANISLDRARFAKIVGLWKNNVNLAWAPVGGLDVNTVDADIVRTMGESGCHSFPLGLETASERIQKYIGKIIPKDKVAEICLAARKEGIWTHGLFIIGFPEEKEEDINAIFDYASETDLDSISLFALSILPGSQLYSLHIRDGNFNPDVSRIVGAHFHLSTLPYERITRLRGQVALRFFWWKVARELRFSSLKVRLRSPKFLNMLRFIARSIKRFLLLRQRDKL